MRTARRSRTRSSPGHSLRRACLCTGAGHGKLVIDQTWNHLRDFSWGEEEVEGLFQFQQPQRKSWSREKRRLRIYSHSNNLKGKVFVQIHVSSCATSNFSAHTCPTVPPLSQSRVQNREIRHGCLDQSATTRLPTLRTPARQILRNCRWDWTVRKGWMHCTKRTPKSLMLVW